jgi:hypothetical protein
MNNIVNPSITATSDEGTPTWRCIASAPASRNAKNNAAGIRRGIGDRERERRPGRGEAADGDLSLAADIDDLREGEIAAGEIVDAAIPLGLADHRGNIGRREGARIEQGGQAREIRGMLHRQAMDVGLHGDGYREALYTAKQ